MSGSTVTSLTHERAGGVWLAACSAVSVGAHIPRCEGAPEEIQVYIDDMTTPGHFGLDVHNNFVFSAYRPSLSRPPIYC
jgi:hypothetical protein